jgi:hypothetical protein
VMGWYGKCGDTVCNPIELSDHASIIHQVFQWSTDAVTAKSFVSDAPPELNDFTTLECGKAYLIYLKPALSSGSINTLTLEHFVSSSSEDENLGGVGEPECLTEVVATTLAANVNPGDLTLTVPVEVTTELTNALLDAPGTAYVKIDEGTPIEETAEIASSGSFVLTSGLLYAHGIGATLRTFVTEQQLIGIPADPGASLDAPTIESGQGADINCEPFALGTDAWIPNYQMARIHGQFDTYKSDYIQWTAGRDGVLESIDILMNNSFNLPGAEIRGYILENNGPDTTNTVRWTITYDMIKTAMAVPAKRVSHNSGNAGPSQNATFAWVNVPIKGSIGQKRGVKYKMQIAGDTYQVDGQTHTSGWINAGHKFGMIASGNKNKIARENQPDISWSLASAMSGGNSFPFIRTNVGCQASDLVDGNETAFTCDGAWYDNSLTAETSGVCYELETATVDVDDNNGYNIWGGHYVYQGVIQKAIYNTSGNQTTLYEVPYYLRDGSVLSSFNKDYAFLTVSGGAFAQTGIKPRPGRYTLQGDRWVGPESELYKNADKTWTFVNNQYLQGFFTSVGTSTMMNETVLHSDFDWGDKDVMIEAGGGTQDYMLYRAPGAVDDGQPTGDWNWRIGPFDPQDGKITDPHAIAYSAWDETPKCLMDMMLDHGQYGKLTLYTSGSSYWSNSSILVDAEQGPQGPGPGEALSATDFKPFLEANSKCLFLQDDGNGKKELIFNFQNLIMNDEADGYAKTTKIRHSGSSPMVSKNMEYDVNDNGTTAWDLGEEVLTFAYLIKSSHLATYPDMAFFHKAITQSGKHYSIDINNVDTAFKLDGGEFGQIHTLKKWLGSTAFSVSTDIKFDNQTAFEGWKNGEDLYIVVCPHNQTDTSVPGFNDGMYYYLNPFAFGGNGGLPMCSNPLAEEFSTT